MQTLCRRAHVMKILVPCILLLLAGCASNPTPFNLGDPVPPIQGCSDYRARGGFCVNLPERLQQVLDEAHASHHYRTDQSLYQRKDYWSANLVGDCEDFALWARKRLLEYGIKSDLIYARTERGEEHLVLSVEGWILDSRYRWLHRRDDMRYDWISIGRPDGTWYRIKG